MHSIKVMHPGMYTTVQDAGRPGVLRCGLPPSGAMDRPAFEEANRLIGNARNAAVLECTGTMPALEFCQPAEIAVVYADRHEVMAAEGRVSFEPMRKGYRAYISVAGGIDVAEVMGSRSTYAPGALGGVEGRPLRAGDVLNVGPAAGRSFVERPSAGPDRPAAGPALRVIPGPEADWFDCGGLNTFLTEEFFVSAQSDRIGIRLEGPRLSFCSEAQMVSAGLGWGTIQVPPSGRPIIMMADHPTTGGYPRIGHVVAEDLPYLAQARPGASVRFVEVRQERL